MKNCIFVLSATMAISSCLPLAAEERPSAIRAAAVEKLAQRMGALRGGIAPNERIVILTTEMIEQRTQPKPAPEIPDAFPQNGYISTKPKLPPIVWEMGPGINRLIKKIIESSASARTDENKKRRFPAIPGMTTVDATAPRSTNEAFETLQKQAGEIVGQIIPAPVTNLKLYAGKYKVSILVRH